MPTAHFKSAVGIVAYGTALPKQKVLTSTITQSQGKSLDLPKALGVLSKTVPSVDEDTITLATAAGKIALDRFLLNQGHKQDVGTLFIGSESHPSAVKPSGTVLKEALGLSDYLSMADLQFACKAGSQSLQIALAFVQAKMSKNAMAIGADTAQARPGDALEYTAAAGAAAFIVGHEDGDNQLLAKLLGTKSVATDTPDFWRKPKESYPQHFGRFTGEPAYFKHVTLATQALLEQSQLTPSEIDFCVFHTPNAKFPQQVAKQLGFSKEQLAPSLVVKEIGNTYAGASLLALTAVLDVAPVGAKILVCSYGSGAGADAFLFETTEHLVEQRKKYQKMISTQIKALETVDLATYEKMRQANEH
jgi:hydroxymethylglutaryl-CoA synthase